MGSTGTPHLTPPPPPRAPWQPMYPPPPRRHHLSPHAAPLERPQEEREPEQAGGSCSAGTAVQQQAQPTFYDLLGISSEGSTFDDVRAAYRRMARKYHPDVSPLDATKEHTCHFI